MKELNKNLNKSKSAMGISIVYTIFNVLSAGLSAWRLWSIVLFIIAFLITGDEKFRDTEYLKEQINSIIIISATFAADFIILFSLWVASLSLLSNTKTKLNEGVKKASIVLLSLFFLPLMSFIGGIVGIVAGAKIIKETKTYIKEQNNELNYFSIND